MRSVKICGVLLLVILSGFFVSRCPKPSNIRQIGLAGSTGSKIWVFLRHPRMIYRRGALFSKVVKKTYKKGHTLELRGWGAPPPCFRPVPYINVSLSARNINGNSCLCFNTQKQAQFQTQIDKKRSHTATPTCK